jgi:serine/threonine protein phosphatase PrpC
MKPGNTRSDASQSLPPGQAEPTWGSVSARAKVELGAFSHRGKVRPLNEDSFLVACFKRSMFTLLTNLLPGQIPEPYAETGYVMIIADGMGGLAGGEVAGQTAIRALVELFIQTPDWIMRPDAERAPEVLRRMRERVAQLTDALTKRAQAEPHLSGMGTTLTLAASLGPDLVIAHVGASRAYILRRGHLLRLTSDQTVAQQLAEAGVIRPEDVSTHYTRRMLTGSITAAGEKAEAELHHVKLIDGDQLLLCSDGLTELVTEAKISEALEEDGQSEDACRALVDLALEAGGQDNVTVILGRYHFPEL